MHAGGSAPRGVVAALWAVAASIAATPLIPGSYVATVKDAESTRVIGTWRVVFSSSCGYEAYNGSSKIAAGSAGRFTMAPSQRVMFTDLPGPHACRGSAAVGVYHWSFIYRFGLPSLLLLKPIRDACPGRRAVFSSGLQLKPKTR